MAVIAEVRVPPGVFELGGILSAEGESTVLLESVVPLGERAVPFVRVRDDDHEALEARFVEHPGVEEFRPIGDYDDERLYALDWIPPADGFVRRLRAHEGALLAASGTATGWAFDLRFPSHEALSAFVDDCTGSGVDLTLDRVYDPMGDDPRPWHGLTDTQRETLVKATREGYYAIPREVSTKELAADLGVSDQAVTERLRRGIETLVGNALAPEEDDPGDGSNERR